MRHRWIAVAAGLLAVGGAVAVRAAGSHAADDGIACVTVGRMQLAHQVIAEGNLRAVHATSIAVPQIEGLWGQLKLAWLAPDGASVKVGDDVVRFDRAEAEKQLRDLRVELDAADGRLRKEQIKAAASYADKAAAAVLVQHQAEQARRFQAKDPLLFTRTEITLGELDERLATARQAQAERAREAERQVCRSNLALAQLARQRTLLALGHAETALAHLEIRAPTDGILVLQRDEQGEIPKLGVRIWPGQQIAEIPAPGVIEAELFVLEVDGNGLDVGQSADVIVASHPELTFHGKIQLIDKLARPREPGSPVQYVSVVVALDRTDPAVAKPGQRVRAALALGQADALVVPRQAVFEQGGKTIVYRRGAHGFAPVTVELGAATPARVAVVSGLVEGDVIAQRDPTRSLEASLGGGSAASPKEAAP